MGNSTISIQDIIDTIASAGSGNTSPLNDPGTYGSKRALSIANETIADMLSQRFNWKWNRALAPVFYTNTWQQDYPMIGLTNIDWLEVFQWVDINNTSIPKPISRPGETYVVRALDRASLSTNASGKPSQLCWFYNYQLSYGQWPGAAQTYYALVGQNPTEQSPPRAITDANGNILVLTTTGTTGAAAPVLPANSAEKATVNDGSCVWTVAGPYSQGFRLGTLPGATGPVYQINVAYQMRKPTFETLQDLINPVPDDYAQYFRRGYRTRCAEYSPDPRIAADFPRQREAWMLEMLASAKQGDKEQSSYGLVAASFPMDSVFSALRNPQDPSQPY